MIPLLAALMAGFGLSKFLRSGWPAYPICLPLSVLVYYLTRVFFSLFQSSGTEIPGIEFIIIVGVLQSPVLMLGIYLGRRHTKRNTFQA